LLFYLDRKGQIFRNYSSPLIAGRSDRAMGAPIRDPLPFTAASRPVRQLRDRRRVEPPIALG